MKKLTYEQFVRAWSSGISNVTNHADEINDLNVFPVPDGDTGSNMSMTLTSGLIEIKNITNKSISLFMTRFAKGTLMGARGNSGVISSQIVKGFSDSWTQLGKEMTIRDFCKGFKKAKLVAYNSVQDPVEGTILTLIRKLSENKRIQEAKFKNFNELAKYVQITSKEIVDDTPNLLKVLKDANVVDSGAYGWWKFFEGFQLAILGKPITQFDMTSEVGIDRVLKANANKNIGYCTEFIMTLKNPNTAIHTTINNYLKKEGDSIVLVQDQDILKIHIHTKQPGKVMETLHKYGEFSKIKIENMTTQVEENHVFNLKNKIQKISIVVVASGKGIISEFNELGITNIIEGGQSMNPSAQDIINQIEETQAHDIIVLPNNSNIILAAEQAAKVVNDKKQDKKVHVLPTKTIPQGLIAVLNFDEDFNVKENLKLMENAIKTTISAAISYSIKDTKYKNIEIKKNQYLSIIENEITNASNDLFEIATKVLEDILLKKDEIELITVFLGDNIEEKISKKLEKYVKSHLKDVEVEIKNGGQPIYLMLIMAE